MDEKGEFEQRPEESRHLLFRFQKKKQVQR